MADPEKGKGSDTSGRMNEGSLAGGEDQREEIERQPESAEEQRVTFGHWLRARRFEAGLTQREAAERAGMQTTYWARLEAGQRFPSRRMIRRVAAAVEAPVPEACEAAGFVPAEQGKDEAVIPAAEGAVSQAEMRNRLLRLEVHLVKIEQAQTRIESILERIETTLGGKQ